MIGFSQLEIDRTGSGYGVENLCEVVAEAAANHIQQGNPIIGIARLFLAFALTRGVVYRQKNFFWRCTTRADNLVLG